MRKSEERETKELINKFERYHFTKDASKLFIEIMSNFASLQIGVPDALIGAIAKANSLPIFTLNLSDFRQINGLQIYKPSRKLTS